MQNKNIFLFYFNNIFGISIKIFLSKFAPRKFLRINIIDRLHDSIEIKLFIYAEPSRVQGLIVDILVGKA